ncbi:MAG: hypothetical protein BGO95_07580 [Micrococcales bacterium 73-13]|nr:MAG: hypothetical protein BGO95_07580 [Micrococcales bacterium 73-13]
MAKASEPRTRPTDVPVPEYLASVEPADRRAEAERIVALMTAATGARPIMWGDSIIGWGETSVRYADGREVSWPALGFSPRRTQHTLYFLHGFDALGEELSRLGPHRLGRGCLYIKRFDRVDPDALAELVRAAWTSA